MSLTPAELGAVVRGRRLELGLTQVQVVQAIQAAGSGAGISEPTYRSVETGRTSPTDLTLAAISKGLGWPANRLAQIRDGLDPDDPPAAEARMSELQMAAAIGRLLPEERAEVEAMLREKLNLPERPE